MKEDRKLDKAIDNEIKYKKRHKEKKKFSGNNDYHKELHKYKQSFYLIKKAIDLIKNHYHNKINRIDNLRKKERDRLFYLKKKNIILEDKCSFYSEHVEELKKIYAEQLNLKNDKIQNLLDENKNHSNENESNIISILKLREDQLERLSQQLNIINDLYHKQVDNNKKLIREIEDINKSILYLNNKVQEEKNNTKNIKRKLKFYKKYNKNKKKLKLNFENINKEEEKQQKKDNNDVCLSILCFLKTELEIIDDENKKININKDDKQMFKIKSPSSSKKLLDSNFRRKKASIFQDIYKKRFFSFYEEKFTEKDKVKFENKKIFSFPLNFKKKLNSKRNIISNKKKKITEISSPQDKEKPHKNERWNNLSLNNVYFHNSFNENFNSSSEYAEWEKEYFDRHKDGNYTISNNNNNNEEYNDKNNSEYNYTNNDKNENNNKIHK